MSVSACACVKTGLAVALGLRYGVECILEASKLAGKWDFETMDWKKLKRKDALAALLHLPLMLFRSHFFPAFIFFPFPLLLRLLSPSLPPSLSVHITVDSNDVRT